MRDAVDVEVCEGVHRSKELKILAKKSNAAGFLYAEQVPDTLISSYLGSRRA